MGIFAFVLVSLKVKLNAELTPMHNQNSIKAYRDRGVKSLPIINLANITASYE